MQNTNPHSTATAASAISNDACLLVSGEIFLTGSSLFGTEVILYEEGKESQKFICCLNGFFCFKMDYEKMYSIKVRRADCATKVILFDNHLFGEMADKRYYEFGIALNNAATDASVLDSDVPAAIIRYSPEKNAFEHDQAYAERRKSNNSSTNQAA